MKSETNDFGNGRVRRSLSLPPQNFDNSRISVARIEEGTIKTATDTDLQENDTTSKSIKINNPNFSVFQSNVLYSLFFLGTFIIMGLDIVVQMSRKSYISNVTIAFMLLLVVNVILWVDFNSNMRVERTSSSETKFGFFEDLLEDSTSTLLCFIIVPFLWLKNGTRLV